MTEKRLRKILHERPYLIDDAFQLSLTEVNEIIQATGVPSVERIVTRAKEKDGWNPKIELTLQKLTQKSLSSKFTSLRIKTQLLCQNIWVSHYRVIFTWIIILLFAGIMILTPTGRAVAENVIQYIVHLFDGRLVINQSNNDSDMFLIDDKDEVGDSEQQNVDSDFVYVNTFEDFTKATGKTPFILPLACSEIYYVHEPEIDYLELHARYDSKAGQIITYQIWNVDGLISSTLTGYSAYEDNDSIYYSIEEESGYIYIVRGL